MRLLVRPSSVILSMHPLSRLFAKQSMRVSVEGARRMQQPLWYAVR